MRHWINFDGTYNEGSGGVGILLVRSQTDRLDELAFIYRHVQPDSTFRLPLELIIEGKILFSPDVGMDRGQLRSPPHRITCYGWRIAFDELDAGERRSVVRPDPKQVWNFVLWLRSSPASVPWGELAERSRLHLTQFHTLGIVSNRSDRRGSSNLHRSGK